eukprot:Gb_22665 [translate_table: standard]
MAKSSIFLISAVCVLLFIEVVSSTENTVECSDTLSPAKHTNPLKPSDGVSFRLLHLHGKCSPFRTHNTTWPTIVFEAIKRDVDRYKFLHRSLDRILPTDVNEPVASGQTFGTGNYIIKTAYGTPAQSFYQIIDTGSDVTWIPCNRCSGCDSKASSPFDSSKSSSYRALACTSAQCLQVSRNRECVNSECNFKQAYGDGSMFQAVLSSENLTLGSDSVPDFIFGCVHVQTGLLRSAPGLVGLGRQPISFLSQTAKLHNNTFSYCLPSIMSSAFSGSLRLGKGVTSAPGLKYTQLLTNPAMPSFYYVGLEGISVGDERVTIPPGTFALDPSTGGGIIIDSGTVISRLVRPAYNAMREAFRRKLSGVPSGPTSSELFDTCYDVSSGTVDFPSVTLHFAGDLDLKLPRENSIIPQNSERKVECLAFAVPPGELALSVFGNYQQQNWRIVYDVPQSRLGIAAERCSA